MDRGLSRTGRTSRQRLTEREERVKAALDDVRARCDVAARVDADPVGIVRRFADPADREIVALVAACTAFGSAKVIRAKLDDLLARIGATRGGAPARAADDPAALKSALRTWRARVFTGDDVARLILGARALQRAHGSLGRAFESHLAAAGDLREGLAAFCDALRKGGGLGRDGDRRGPAHLLPDPRGASGCKRLLLFLRWVVRPADGVDLGMWDVDPARLLVPVDVHIHRLSRNLGLTRQKTPSWRTTEEITRALARFDPADPVRYDFSLCHMGMLQRCPSRRDAALCEGCGVQPVCIHWERAANAANQRRERGANATDRRRKG